MINIFYFIKISEVNLRPESVGKTSSQESRVIFALIILRVARSKLGSCVARLADINPSQDIFTTKVLTDISNKIYLFFINCSIKSIMFSKDAMDDYTTFII